MKIMTVVREEAPANFVPAAAVIRREQALFGMIGRKGCVGGLLSEMLNVWAQPNFAFHTDRLEDNRGNKNF